ncbi:MAG: ornithine cyclodeaminase family protein [Chloroflexi bacterium]|nr:ornithine cyclodeaminase family protein [Chloroflexota bacterium]
MLILNSTAVSLALPMNEAIEAMKQAYAAVSAGKVEMPIRAHLPIEPHTGVSLFMPAFLQTEHGDALGVKVVSLFNGNPSKGLSTIQAAVLMLNEKTGQALALLEGSTLTAIRTGAGSGAATDILARQDSSTLAIFGAGVQARSHLEAICTIREIETVWIYSPTRENAEALIEEMAGHAPIPSNMRVAASPSEALKDADIVCTTTTSHTPVFAASDLKSGAHVNAVGSYTPEMQEIPAEMLSEALIVIDEMESSMEEAGDLLIPIAQGIISQDNIHAELGEIVLGKKPGRTSPDQLTFFKTVGIAAQDAMAGKLALENAQAMDLGQQVDF